MKYLILVMHLLLITPVMANTLPDFKVKSIRMHQNCEWFYFTVENSGGQIPAYAYAWDHPTIRLTFSDGHHPWEKEIHMTLAEFDQQQALRYPGAKVTRTFTFKTEGSVQADILLDMGNRIPESNENNNGQSKKLTCQSNPEEPSRPDIHFSYIKVLPTCDIKVRLDNKGPGYLPNRSWSTHDPFRMLMGVSFNQWHQDEAYLNTMDPNKNLRLEGGSMVYIFDHTNFNENYTHGRNIRFSLRTLRNEYPRYEFETTKFLKCQKDIELLRIESQNIIKVGQQATFRVLVINRAEKITEPTQLSFKIGGESNPQIFSVPSLRPRQKKAFTRRMTFGRSGKYTLRAKVDINNNINESNENNNQKSKSITVRP